MVLKKTSRSLDWIILDELKKDQGYVSGEQLARKLDISRQGLWKHIGNLTSKGYEIIAVPHLGYKLTSCPDKLYPWEIQHNLETSFIAKEIHHQEVLDSTQSLVWQKGLEGTKEGLVAFSETQKKGKGRLGREWVSGRGGIYFSLLLKPKFLHVQDVSQIVLIIALGVLKGIRKATGIWCAVKWPNDIFLNGKKIAGILCEINAEVDKVNFIVVGVGINVNSKDLPPQATSLFLQAKKKFSRVEIAQRVLEEIEMCYQRAEREDFSKLVSEWKQLCFLWGKRVRVKVFDKYIEGEALNIDERGYLMLRRDNGLLEKISAGDIIKVSLQ